MELLKFVREHQAIIGAVIAGTFAITAAYIRRDRRWENKAGKTPVFRLLLFPLLALLAGGGLLATEYFVFNLDPDGELIGLNNPGAALALGGCLLLSAGLIWGSINVVRALTWPKATDLDPGTDSVPPSAVAAPKSAPLQAARAVRKTKS